MLGPGAQTKHKGGMWRYCDRTGCGGHGGGAQRNPNWIKHNGNNGGGQRSLVQTKCGGGGWRGPPNCEVLKWRIFNKVVKE